ncbi:uncharacterized protein LOC134727857 [Mytilus trossulus]|uniref:uncharacterized protein LOC134727857 n=1 Tax=Mytilus trossulus TaxID=6551 RepID=UPI0030058AFE
MENNDQELKNIEKEVQFYLNRVDEHQGTSKQNSMSEQNITVIQKEQDSEDLLTAVQLKSELKSEPPMKITLKSKAKSIRSKLSGKSKISDKSNVNSLYIKQKLKVEELRVRVEYAQQEAELLKQKANVEASIKVLNTQREFAESQKVFEVLDDCMESSEEEFEDKHLSETREKRNIYYDNNNQENDLSPVTQITTQPDPKVVQTLDTKSCTLDTKAAPYYPTTINNSSEELATFIVKKDLLISRIQKFDDKAEYFGSWKKSFCDTVKELSLSASEEVDLLVKYLGPESTKSAVSIRSANYLDLSKARDRIWERLHDRYARPEMVETSIKQKLMYFPKITYKDPKQLYDLLDIVSEIAAIKTYEQYRPLFSYFDSSAGVNPIVAKLPYQLQEKWSTEANKYKEYHSSSYPPFEVFEIFLRKIARMKNDPSFIYEDTGINSANVHNMTKPKQRQQQNVSVLKTDFPVTKNQQYTRNTSDTVCPLHNTNHTLNKCRQFRLKPIREHQDFFKSKGLCFRCCGQKGHLARDCTAAVTCEVCKSTTHPTALHIEKFTHQQPTTKFQEQKTEPKLEQDTQKVVTACTQICKNRGTSKSCSKTILVRVYPNGQPENSLLLYAIIDEQSNRSLAKSSFFEHFNIHGPEVPFTLSSCSGSFSEYGRRASDFAVESFDASCKLNLPTLIECDQVPDIRTEIPSPDVAHAYNHLRDIADFIPDINDNADIMLLIGRDLLKAHHVIDQRLGTEHCPFAQKLFLGWAIIGESCLSATHVQQDSVSVLKTFTLKDGRTTTLEPCNNNFNTKDGYIFQTTPDDNIPGLSIEDKEFLALMEHESDKDEEGCWTAPLPFRRDRIRLPNNRVQALRRAKSLDYNLQKHPEKHSHVYEFMGKLLTNGHAEVAPQITEQTECWYLPLFAIYHSKKPGNIRCVFDSSAKFNDISLNDVLLSGPDLVNSLLGILLRFRQRPVVITADIEQMFYRFSVPPEQRNYLRFYWHKDNDPKNEMIEYRMTRHVFGNKPSPAVATFGLRNCVKTAEQDVRDFVERNFYVDDALCSFDTSVEAVDLITRTKKILKEEGNIRLHKISSNNLEVIKSFSPDDLAKDLKNINLDLNEAPLQISLGVQWDMSKDCFTFRVSQLNSTSKPFTKRGVLATINGLYDPMGFVAPVTVSGKIIMRDIMALHTDWDDPLPETYLSKWSTWKNSLEHLNNVTIPRLELCAAVLAINLKDSVTRHLTLEINSTFMYTVSQQRRFYVYVGNRIDMIRQSTSPSQWSYVPSEDNPADTATRLILLEI